MKKLIAIVLTIVMMASSAVYAQAADETRTADETQTPTSSYQGEDWIAKDSSTLLGDVDGNGTIDVGDALYLQLHLAGIRQLTQAGLLRADADLNDSVESLDVTVIQRYIAQFNEETYVNRDVTEAKAAKQYDRQRRTILNAINSFTRAKGVDISEHNGNVDMNKIKAAGYSFVIIRLGYGDNMYTQDDSRFEENVRKAEAAGLDWGAYIYSYALSVGEARSEVNHTLRLLKGKHPTMPIAFDWEEDDYKERNGYPSDAMVLQIARTYLDGIRSAGYYPIIYTGYNWLKGAFNHSSIIDTYDIWYAQWSSSYDYHDRPLGMWQYGGSVNYIESPYISGVSGEIDKNYSYKNYPMIIKAYGYNNHEPLLRSYAATSAAYGCDIPAESENLPDECDGVMGDSLRR